MRREARRFSVRRAYRVTCRAVASVMMIASACHGCELTQRAAVSMASMGTSVPIALFDYVGVPRA